METAKTLSAAINLSEMRNSSVKLEIANINLLWLELEANEEEYGQYDYSKVGPGEYDVWGWSSSTPKDGTDWRLSVVEIDG